MPITEVNCPFCGKSDVILRVDGSEVARIGRKRADVGGLHSFACNSCHRDFQTDDQHDANVDLIQAAITQLTPIAPREIRSIRAKLRLSQDEARLIFGGGRNAFSKYERGEVVPTEASAILMRAAIAVPGLIQHLAEARMISPKAEWGSLKAAQTIVYVDRFMERVGSITGPAVAVVGTPRKSSLTGVVEIKLPQGMFSRLGGVRSSQHHHVVREHEETYNWKKAKAIYSVTWNSQADLRSHKRTKPVRAGRGAKNV